MNHLLLPRPVRLELTGGEIATATLPAQEILDAATMREPGTEAYRLEINATGARLIARTPTGLRWARATLAQLRAHPRIPRLVIEDAPRFAHRGVLLDISRDRVPTMATLLALVDQLAGWKINHLQFNIEHTVAYRGHEPAWRAADPLTLDELSTLDAYCAERGVAFTANQNCLGHCERWLRHPRYQPLAEVATGRMQNGVWYIEPNTLCPTDPRSLEFVADLLHQQLPRCSGAYANIGCDEPWDLGHGRSQAACDARGKAAVFSEYVSHVAAIASSLGKRPQFWCDPHPNENNQLPADLVALVWGYDAHTDFATRLQAHRRAGREAWVAPGTSCWNSSTGRTWNRRANLDRAAAERDAAGFLCTAWGDGGHRQQWPITLFGFADAAMTAWSGPGHYDDRAAGAQAFGSPALGEWLAQLGNADAELSRGERPNLDAQNPVQPPHNKNATWHELHTPLWEPPQLGNVAAWREVADRLDALTVALPAGIPQLVADECRHAVEVARWSVDRALLRRTKITREGRQALAARMAELIGEHRRLWLAHSRYGGLEDSCQHYRWHVTQW